MDNNLDFVRPSKFYGKSLNESPSPPRPLAYSTQTLTFKPIISTMLHKTSLRLMAALLLSTLLFANCKKDKNDDDDLNPSTEYYFVGKFDGQNLIFEVDDQGSIGMANSISGSAGPVTCVYSYGCSVMDFNLTDAPFAEVEFPDLFVGDCADIETEFPNLFRLGSYDYGTEVVVRYFDGKDLWESAPAGQNAPVFNVTLSEPTESPFGIYQKVGGDISCILFNATGESKKLENASFVLSFSE